MRQQLLRPLATLLVLVSSLTAARSQPIAVRFNEILADNTQINNVFGDKTAMIELYNTGSLPADLANFSISDRYDYSYPGGFVFPHGTVLAPGAYLLLACDEAYTNMAGLAAPLRLRSNGGILTLYDDELTVMDQVRYGLQVEDRSLVRTSPGTYGLGLPSLGATNTTLPLGSPQALCLNEWMANPLPGVESDFENAYFELYNPTNQPVALGGLVLSNGYFQQLIAPLSFIGTGAQAYVDFVPNGDADAFGTNQANIVSFTLEPEGGTLSLHNAAFQEIHRVNYGPQTENVSEGFLPDGNTNRLVRFPRINDYQTQSPGKPNFLLLTNLYINELLSNPVAPKEDAVELINLTGTNISIGGWWLSNKRSRPKKYLIPPGTFVPAQGFRTFYEGTGTAVGFNTFTTAVPFQFDGLAGGEVVLSQTDSNGNLTGYQAYETFESAAPGLSFGHFKTSVLDDYKFVALTQTTFGADSAGTVAGFRTGAGLSNAPPKFGPVVISEVMYAPSNRIFFLFTNGSIYPVYDQNPDDEFVELRNTSNQSVPLYDTAFPANRWRLQNAVQYVFPLTNLAANSFCIVVGFTPTNGPTLTKFRSIHQVTTNVPIFGPWAGRLEDNVGAVELYQPGSGANPVPYYRVDKVKYGAAYSDRLPRWPLTLRGASLQRRDLLRFGNDPLNWAAVSPATPGTNAPASIQDTDFDGLPDVWEIRYGFNPTNAADALLDPDQDQFSNLGEFLAGTNPTNALSVLRIDAAVPANSPPDYEVWASVQFFAYSNATYRVEYRNQIGDPWKKLGDVYPSPTSHTVRVYDYEDNNFNGEQRYYRVLAPATN
jgi:hypothetical protein